MKKALVVCPYCASGCKIEFTVDNNRIIKAEGANGFTNQGELCLKGYYGWEFLNDTRLLTPRLTQPLVRYKRGEPFTAVSWEEAIRFASSKLIESLISFSRFLRAFSAFFCSLVRVGVFSVA